MRQRAMFRFCDITSTGLPRELRIMLPGRERLWSTAHAIVNPCFRTLIRQHSRRRAACAISNLKAVPCNGHCVQQAVTTSRLPRGNAGAAAQMQDGCGRNTHSHLNTAVSQPLQRKAKNQRYSIFTTMSTATSLRRTIKGITVSNISPTSSPAKAVATVVRLAKVASSPKKTVMACTSSR